MNEILIYKSQDGEIKLDVKFENENIWLTQKDMADLFQTTISNINMHIKNIYEEGELIEEATIKDFLIVQKEGNRNVKRSLTHYNLDMIISVGYRIKSLVATRFRIWATQKIKEYMIKGFVMDDERLKNPPVKGSFVPDYFDEMLERIRDIRASERRVYLRVKEIFTLADDYEPSLKETNLFFSIIQNKLHYAATGMTASEIIANKANSKLPNMGLTSWKTAEIRKTDIIIAKNYLSEKEIDELNRIVVMWLDFAEDQARRKKKIFIKDWQEKLDEFLRFNDREILSHSPKITKKEADNKALNEFEVYAGIRRKEKEDRAEKDYIKELEDSMRILEDGKR